MALVSSSCSTFPSSGRELILELKRSTGNRGLASSSEPQYLVPYNVKLVRECFQDLNRSFQSLSDEMQAMSQADEDEDDESNHKPSMNARPSILFHNASIQRQKRCLLAYHKNRMDRIKDLSISQKSDLSFNNAHESEFSSEYQDLRESYAAAVFDLEILPPTSHMVQVRVLDNSLGQVVLESGRSVNFCKGSSLYLPRTDVLEFMQSGSLELCDGEEVDF
jgi:GINS complex subunit 1